MYAVSIPAHTNITGTQITLVIVMFSFTIPAENVSVTNDLPAELHIPTAYCVSVPART